VFSTQIDGFHADVHVCGQWLLLLLWRSIRRSIMYPLLR